MKKKNNSIKLLTFMCFIVCMMCTIQTSPILAQETKNITFSKKLTREEAADFEELAMWLSDKYGVTPEESREDLRETLEQMKKNGMLEEANKEKLW